MIGPSVWKRQELEEMRQKLANDLKNVKQLTILAKSNQAEALKQQKQKEVLNLQQMREKMKASSSGKQPKQSSSQHSVAPSTRREIPKKTIFKSHLEKVLQLHNKAKELISKDPLPQLEPVEEAPTLTEKMLKSHSESPVPLRLSVFVTESAYRKAHNLPPPVTYKTTKTGEVFPCHLVGKPSPAYDPLVKSETRVARQFVDKHRRADSVEVKAHTHDEMSVDSVLVPKGGHKHFEKETKETLIDNDLTPAPRGQEHKVITPKSREYSFTFRDIPRDTPPPRKPKRAWVNQRMKVYDTERVKKDFVPTLSQKKKFQYFMNQQYAVMNEPRASNIRKFHKVSLSELSK